MAISIQGIMYSMQKSQISTDRFITKLINIRAKIITGAYIAKVDVLTASFEVYEQYATIDSATIEIHRLVIYLA